MLRFSNYFLARVLPERNSYTILVLGIVFFHRKYHKMAYEALKKAFRIISKAQLDRAFLYAKNDAYIGIFDFLENERSTTNMYYNYRRMGAKNV